MHFYAHPSWSSSSSYKMYDAFCGTYQKKLYILIHALCMWLIEIDWSHATLRSPVKHLQLHKQGGNFPCNLIWSLLPHHLRKSGHAMRSDALYAGVSKHAGPKPGMLVCWSIISATQPFDGWAQTPLQEHLRVVGCERPSTPNCKHATKKWIYRQAK